MTERNPILQSLFDRKSVRVYEEKPIPAEMKQAIWKLLHRRPPRAVSSCIPFRHHRSGTERGAGRKL